MWLEPLKEFFFSEVPQATKRRQYFWLGCVGILCVFVAFVLVTLVFGKQDPKSSSSEEKENPTSIETATTKVDLNEARWYKLEDENKTLKEDLNALKTLFQQGVKNQEEEKGEYTNKLEEKINELESQLSAQLQPAPSSNVSMNLPPSQRMEGGEGSSPAISKFSLNLNNGRDLKNKIKTVDDFIPAGAFARTVLLSGLDASASMTASSDPRPMLLRIVNPGTLPRRFQSDLKDCHCLAAAYGDLSSERIYARLEKLTCVIIHSGEIIETQVAGYIAGSDGKAGIRGRVASKDGQFLGRSLVGGVFSGLSSVANPANRQAQINPFSAGNPNISAPSMGQMFISGMSQGATTALDRLSQYYIDRAEQLQPVIQVDAGQVVDIVFTEGTSIGDQTVKHKIEHVRDETRAEIHQDHHSRTPTKNHEGKQYD